MPASSSYDYAVIRLVPSVERGECINVGVILFSRTRRFLGILSELNRQRLEALAPHVEYEEVQRQLDHLVQICRGGRGSGPIGELSQPERFHWLVSPRSTILQTSAVHCGLCSDPESVLQSLFHKLVG